MKRIIIALILLFMLSGADKASAGELCPRDSNCTKPRISLRIIRPKYHNKKGLKPRVKGLYKSILPRRLE